MFERVAREARRAFYFVEAQEPSRSAQAAARCAILALYMIHFMRTRFEVYYASAEADSQPCCRARASRSACPSAFSPFFYAKEFTAECVLRKERAGEVAALSTAPDMRRAVMICSRACCSRALPADVCRAAYNPFPSCCR